MYQFRLLTYFLEGIYYKATVRLLFISYLYNKYMPAKKKTTSEDIDRFNDFMVSKWAFIRNEDWSIAQNYNYPYSLQHLYDEYKKKYS